MSAAPVTVTDRLPFTISVSPEQAAAYCRKRPSLAGWTESRGSVWWLFSHPDGLEQIAIPVLTDARDYSRCMRWAIDELVRMGCADQPSTILRAMAEET